MKSLVVYSSKSGNTKKLAEAVYKYLTGEKELCAVADAPDPSGYNFVAVRFWLQKGQPDPDSQAFEKRSSTSMVCRCSSSCWTPG